MERSFIKILRKLLAQMSGNLVQTNGGGEVKSQLVAYTGVLGN
jgi:hypothetical protein